MSNVFQHVEKQWEAKDPPVNKVYLEFEAWID